METALKVEDMSLKYSNKPDFTDNCNAVCRKVPLSPSCLLNRCAVLMVNDKNILVCACKTRMYAGDCCYWCYGSLKISST